MEQSMREQLQALVKFWNKRADELSCDGNHGEARALQTRISELEATISTSPTAVSVKAGWIAKDIEGVAWFLSKPSYREDCEWWDSNGAMHRFLDGAITDPWPDHPNGGPECILEVK